MQYTDPYTPSHEQSLGGGVPLPRAQRPSAQPEYPRLFHMPQLAHHIYRTIQNQPTGSTPAATPLLWPAGQCLPCPECASPSSTILHLWK